ncbi:ABC transporter ATP-binding protein [Sulfuricurvum sp.]|uniref:ABC transporter ATP-binding protein n=1 Tax=Sulfuricurvum sp. TaxID=2025608 RepID=UPI0025EC7E98|nr:ABC transporter ATP-binding protein [Sulfuricurvum sp.]
MNFIQSVKKIILLFERIYETKFYKKFYVLIFIAFIVSGLEIFSAFLLAPIFNLLSSGGIKDIFMYNYISHYVHTYNTALIYSLILFLLGNVLKNIFTIFYMNISTLLRLDFTLLLRNRMFKNILSGYYVLKKEVTHNVGEINNIIMWETHNINNSIVALLLLLNSAIIVFLLLAYLLYTNFTNTLMILIAVFGIIHINKYFFQKVGEYSKEVSAQWGVLSGIFNEIIRNIKVVYTKNAFDYEVKRFALNNKINSDVTQRRDIFSNVTGPITEIFSVLTMIITIYMVSSNSNSLGESVTYIYIIFRLMPYLKMINTNKVLFVSSIGSIDNILHYTKEDKPETILLKKEINKITDITISKLSFSYNNNDPVLNAIDLNLQRGNIIEIVGESGSGKSTFLDILLKIRDEYQGSILINGIELKDISKESWYSKIGYVPQDPLLFDDTLEYNVAYPNRIDKEKVIKCLEQASLTQYTDNLAYQVGENGSKLSGGQKQRVSIARSLYNDPDLLFFDEATSSLDKETEKNIVETINNLPKHLIILLVTHRELNVQYTDKIHFKRKSQ